MSAFLETADPRHRAPTDPIALTLAFIGIMTVNALRRDVASPDSSAPGIA